MNEKSSTKAKTGQKHYFLVIPKSNNNPNKAHTLQNHIQQTHNQIIEIQNLQNTINILRMLICY